MSEQRFRAFSRRTIDTILWGMALLLMVNGLWMLSTPEHWFWSVPGVANTGDFNPHLVKDVGFTYALLAAGLLLAIFSIGSRGTLLVACSLWLVAHAILHVVDVATGCLPPENLLIDTPGVFLPALLLTLVTLWDLRLENEY